MHALPFLIALPCALVIAPRLLRGLESGSHTRPNYRGRELPFPFGVLVPAAAAVALVPLALLARLDDLAVFHPELAPIALYAVGVICLGLIDDTLEHGAPPAARGVRGPAATPRGLRGHAACLRRGELTTGGSAAAQLHRLDHKQDDRHHEVAAKQQHSQFRPW